MDQLRLKEVEQMVKTMADVAIANEKYFSDLDGVCGDADFGVSLATGFNALLAQWPDLDRSSISGFLLKVSMVIANNVGGCSGPIWSTGFMKASLLAKSKDGLTLEDGVQMLRAALAGMTARGGAQLGDKTLLDALAPVADRLEECRRRPSPDWGTAAMEGAAAAATAVEQARDWVAKRGRQSFTGERSRGSPDPGMVAVALMLKTIAGRFAGETQPSYESAHSPTRCASSQPTTQI